MVVTALAHHSYHIIVTSCSQDKSLVWKYYWHKLLSFHQFETLENWEKSILENKTQIIITYETCLLYVIDCIVAYLFRLLWNPFGVKTYHHDSKEANFCILQLDASVQHPVLHFIQTAKYMHYHSNGLQWLGSTTFFRVLKVLPAHF